MLNETDYESIENHVKLLKDLQEGGLNIGYIEDLLTCDPFNVCNILEAKWWV
jgi:hypothetical protein